VAKSSLCRYLVYGENMQSQIQKQLEKQLAQHACYVLITCDSASSSGEMQVEMSYGGDALLAAYLLEGACAYIEEEVENQKQESPF